MVRTRSDARDSVQKAKSDAQAALDAAIAALTAEIVAARQEAAGAIQDLFQGIEQAKSELAGQISDMNAAALQVVARKAASDRSILGQPIPLGQPFGGIKVDRVLRPPA